MENNKPIFTFFDSLTDKMEKTHFDSLDRDNIFFSARNIPLALEDPNMVRTVEGFLRAKPDQNQLFLIRKYNQHTKRWYYEFFAEQSEKQNGNWLQIRDVEQIYQIGKQYHNLEQKPDDQYEYEDFDAYRRVSLRDPEFKDHMIRKGLYKPGDEEGPINMENIIADQEGDR